MNLNTKLMNLNTKFTTIQEPTKQENDRRYYKLPFLGQYSSYTQKSLNNIIKRFCKFNTSTKLVFTSFKLSNYFSTKDPVPKCLKSSVVYKFVCISCNASYIGETSRHLTTRISEHLKSDKKSHIFQHLRSSQVCKDSCDETCFSVIDHARSKFTLKIKEGMQIKW